MRHQKLNLFLSLLAAGNMALTASAQTATPENRTVDYLVVFDNTSEEYVNKQGGEQKFANDMVDMINLTLKNSKIDYRFRLAGIHHMDTRIGDITSGMTVAMNDLGVQQARKDCKADIVTLVSEPFNDGMRGISNHNADRFAAYSSVRAESAIENFTAAHEVAHILGCCHSRTASDQAPSEHPWAAAWADENFRTVVSNPLSSEGKQVPIFSGPESVWEENGKKYVLGDKTHDNVRMLKENLPEAVWFGDFLDDSRYFAAEENIVLDHQAQEHLLRVYSNSFFKIESASASWMSALKEVKTMPMNGYYMQDGVFSFSVEPNLTKQDRTVKFRIYGDSDKQDLTITVTQKAEGANTGISEIGNDTPSAVTIHSIDGKRVLMPQELLPKGIYIVNGKKIVR